MADTSVRVDVPGLRRLRADLRRMGDDLADYKDANQATGQLVVDEAEQRAPRRSGRLAGSGRASRALGRVSVLWGGARVPYAGPVHYGWPDRDIDPQPFIVEAAQDTEPTWTEFYQQHIDTSLARVQGRTY